MSDKTDRHGRTIEDYPTAHDYVGFMCSWVIIMLLIVWIPTLFL